MIPMLPSMPIGLLDGKMGYCIYFYILGKYDKRNRYDSVAENLMEDIYSNILNTSDIEVETGVAGIGLGIDYLIKEGYVSGDVNVILEDIDDSIFRKLNNRDYCRNSRVLSLLYLLIYLCTRYEKLMPMIKYLSERMGFNDDLIRKLCAFKEISVAGKLYSTMFNQSFSTDGAVCSLKQDREGRFDLNIDGVSHHSWFRRKKDEFMEALGLPTSRRQNRGLKL